MKVKRSVMLKAAHYLIYKNQVGKKGKSECLEPKLYKNAFKKQFVFKEQTQVFWIIV